MAERLCGTDGFRGPVDLSDAPGRVNAETFEGLAYAQAGLGAEIDGQPPIFIVGGDTRTSSPGLIEAVCHGAASAGAEVWNVGVAPTPVIAWLAREHGAHAIAVTASHNADRDNGYKPFQVGGVKPSREVLDEMESRYWAQQGAPRPKSVDGTIALRPNLSDDYVDSVAAKLGGQDVLAGKLVVIDGANGAASEVAPRLYRALGAEVIAFACDPTAIINGGCGAAHLEGVSKFLAERPEIAADQRFIGAFASDGDADRVMGVDSAGNIVNGNHWMYSLAADQRGIVGTLYTNTALREAVEAKGVEFHECANGDSYVTEMLNKLTANRGEGYKRGGEFTGHLIDLDHLSSGDGIYMGALMAASLAATGQNLGDVYGFLPLWPELMQGIRVDGADGKTIAASEAVQAAIAEEMARYNGAARVVLRASGTEPLVRVWAEGRDQAIVSNVVSRLTAAVRSQVAA